MKLATGLSGVRGIDRDILHLKITP